MKSSVAYRSALLLVVLAGLALLQLGAGVERSTDTAVRYVLETVKAFRTVYSKGIEEQIRKAGVTSREDWQHDDHAIMLNVQFVKAAGAEIKDFELGLISLWPIQESNRPKTEAETRALKKLLEDPDLQVVTFTDGKQFKGIAGDYAIVQACADCHNTHSKSPRRDFRQGDLMGAVVVRLRMQ
jgi:hypothetical protein